jgi:hypothetical protein
MMPRNRAIKVGVSGHRFLQNSPELKEAIHTALDRIAARYPEKPMVLYSSLAAGADQLAGLAAREKGIELVAVIPYDQKRYLESIPHPDRDTFSRLAAEAVDTVQLNGDVEGEAKYLVLAETLVRQMDVLIAVWNGRPARGPGGTGEVVERFRQTGKPLVWIRADNMLPEAPVLLPPSLHQGSIAYENWQD